MSECNKLHPYTYDSYDFEIKKKKESLKFIYLLKPHTPYIKYKNHIKSLYTSITVMEASMSKVVFKIFKRILQISAICNSLC